MKKKKFSIFGVALTLVLLASLFGFATPASADNVEWSAIANPSALATRLNLADVEVGPIAVTPDGGTLFAAVQTETLIVGIGEGNPGGVWTDVDGDGVVDDWALVQSTDGGHNWTATGLVNNAGPITGIAVSPNFATDNTLYVAAWSATTGAAAVFRSTDGGATFIELKQIFDSGGIAIANIWDIDMYPASPYPYVMVATDRDVLVLKDAVFEEWRDQELGAPVDARAVAFAPDFATTNYIWAVTQAGVVTTTNSPGAWGTILANTPALVACDRASIAFPSDYSSTTAPNLWVGIDSAGVADNGGVWRVRGLPVPGPSFIVQQYGVAPIAGTPAADIVSIAVSGPMASATILAGQEEFAGVVGSLNGGVTWVLPVLKQPTGLMLTFVIMAPDFATSGVAYVGTSDGLGTESAFQVSRDGAMSWNQTGLIDTAFAVINDIAVVSLDVIFMVSDNFSLWKTEDATATAPVWERILTPATRTIPGNVLANMTFVATSPDFLTDGVVFATDNAVGIMKATDGGSIFAPMGAPATAITALHVVDATFAFIGAANGQVYRTDDGGYSWLAAVTPPGVAPIASIATSPMYATLGQLLVGNTVGWVYMSLDRGVNFTGFPGPGFPAAGNTFVAFDPNYTTNFLIYAGCPGATNAVIGRLDVTQPALGWTSIDGTMPTAAPAVPSDSFQFDDNVAAGDNGTITVTAGSVTLAPQGAATVAGTVAFPNTLTVTPAMGPVVWTSPAGAGVGVDTILVTAASANSAGTWTAVGATTVTAVTDADGDVGLTATNWYLPDVAGVGAAAPSTITGMVMSPDGTLYASNALAGQGIERSLNPTATTTAPDEGAIAPVFERMNTRLATTATLGTAAPFAPSSMELVVDETLDVVGSKNVFFAIDTTGVAGVDRILTYTDTLATPVVLTAPETGQIYPRVTEVTLDWERLTGALSYHWQIARDAAFMLVADEGFSVYPTTTSDQLRAGQTYYWRVRVDGTPAGAPGLPLLSRWSESRTFTTELGARVWHPFRPIGGVAPGPGAEDVITKPTFQWNGADWATSYELMLADNPDFTGAITKTLTTTSWVCDRDLGYSTTWYWKVRALSDTSESEWSDVGVFTTMAEPVEPVPAVVVEKEPAPPPEVEVVEVPVSPPIPDWALYTIIAIGAILLIFVIVLIMRTRRPV